MVAPDSARAMRAGTDLLSGGRSRLRHPDDDLSEMRACGHPPVSCLSVVEGEYPVDHRLERIEFDCTVHCLEHLRRADGNALDIGASGKDQARIELGRTAAQAPDQGNFAADADCAKRAGERRRAADFNDVIDAYSPGIAALSQSGVFL